MFEWLFKYPLQAFQKGSLIWLAAWPPWLLPCALIVLAGLLAVLTWRRLGQAPAARKAILLALESGFLAVLLIMLWQPALSISTLQPQQNMIAVVVDRSRSMATEDEGGKKRWEAALGVLRSGLLEELKKQFQVRVYTIGRQLERAGALDQVMPEAPATLLAEGLRELASEAQSLPVGAVLLLSDGADTSGGIDLATVKELKRARLAVHAIGFGREKPVRDIEIMAAEVPPRALPGARLPAEVSFRQFGYGQSKAQLQIKQGEKVLASRAVTLKGDGVVQTEILAFQAGQPGAHALEIGLVPLEGEQNSQNNRLTRLVSVENRKPRILYIEGEPKWEYKFIRRAAALDQNLALVSILRTTQNKIYRQGIENPKELEQGFPSTVEELFAYEGLVIGGVEAGYFTATQQELIRQFADRRGGGVLFLGGRGALADGGLGQSILAEMLPVRLPNSKLTFRRDPAQVELSPEGRDALLTRIEEDPERNVARWKQLPYLANYQDVGTPKPGAVVLAWMNAGGRGKLPLLITQNYGRGRTAVFATAGSWRWQMAQPVEDMSHEIFWQQLLRWLVTDTHGRVISLMPRTVYSDLSRIPLSAEVRDQNYLPTNDATVEARILGPGGSTTVSLPLKPGSDGLYEAEWQAVQPGSYVVEIMARRGDEQLGRDVMTFRREDGTAENFHLEQHKEALEKLAAETGGRYWRPGEWQKIPQAITYSEGGITVRQRLELWNMPALFLLALLLRSAEWLLRRRWGYV